MLRFFVFILLFTIKGFALDISPQGIYRATLDACLQVSVEDLSNLKADKLRAGYFPSSEFTELLNYIRRESTTQVVSSMSLEPVSMVKFLLSHPEYRKALSKCYPDKPQMIAFFNKSVENSDRAGKIVGVAAIVAIFRGHTALIGLVQKWSVLAYSILQTTQKAILAGVGISFLRSDSEMKMNVLNLSEVLNSYDSKSMQQPQNTKAEMLESIVRQIAAEQQKIISCGNCPELTQLTKQKKALESFLNNIRQ